MDSPDWYIWTANSTGTFTTKSAYERFFLGATTFEPHKQLWKHWAPLKVKILLSLAILNRVWTADRLARRGMDHPERCALGDQKETAQHVLISCVFARSVWFTVLAMAGIQLLAPTPGDVTFADWWCRAMRMVASDSRKGFHSLVMLVAWELQKYHNRCVFDGVAPNHQTVVTAIKKEAAA